MANLQLGGGHVVTVKAPQAFPAGKDGGLPYSRAASVALMPRDTIDTRLRDGLILSDGQTDYVVNKRGLNPDLDEGATVKLDGRTLSVKRSLNVPDTFREKLRYWSAMLPLLIRSKLSELSGHGNGFW